MTTPAVGSWYSIIRGEAEIPVKYCSPISMLRSVTAEEALLLRKPVKVEAFTEVSVRVTATVRKIVVPNRALTLSRVVCCCTVLASMFRSESVTVILIPCAPVELATLETIGGCACSNPRCPTRTGLCGVRNPSGDRSL